MQEKQQDGESKTNLRRFLCPVCGKHTVLWLLPTTEVKDLPIKCKRCGKESVVSISLEPAPCCKTRFRRIFYLTRQNKGEIPGRPWEACVMDYFLK